MTDSGWNDMTVDEWLDAMPVCSIKYRLISLHHERGDLGRPLREVYPAMFDDDDTDDDAADPLDPQEEGWRA